jgi:hypothetical protein
MELSKVIDEIKRIPPSRLSEVYRFIHVFRLGLESESAQGETSDIMQFAGCWQDMPPDQFDEFLEDVRTRRQQAASGRLDRETLLD